MAGVQIVTFKATRGRIQDFGASTLKALALDATIIDNEDETVANVTDIDANEVAGTARPTLTGVSWDLSGDLPALLADDVTILGLTGTVGNAAIYDNADGSLVALFVFDPVVLTAESLPLVFPDGEIATVTDDGTRLVALEALTVAQVPFVGGDVDVTNLANALLDTDLFAGGSVGAVGGAVNTDHAGGSAGTFDYDLSTVTASGCLIVLPSTGDSTANITGLPDPTTRDKFAIGVFAESATGTLTITFDTEQILPAGVTVTSGVDGVALIDLAPQGGAWVPAGSFPFTSGGGSGDLVSTNNLSDVASTSTALTNLGGVPTTRTVNGHALSANVVVSASDLTTGTLPIGQVPTGTTGSTVPFGNDSRFSDSRTPTTHASSHAAAGSDPVTIAESQVTNLTTDLAAKVPTSRTLAGIDLSVDRSAATLKTALAIASSDVSGFDTQVRTSRLDQMAAAGADVSLASHKLTSVTDPTSAQDAATKAYVDKRNLTVTATKTTAYNAAAGEYVPIDTTSGTVAVTLPTTPADGTVVAVKRVAGATNTGSVVAGGSAAFNASGGATTATLTLLNQAIEFVYRTSGDLWFTNTSLALSGLDTRYTPLATLTTKGDTYAATGSGAVDRVAVGADYLPEVGLASASTGRSFAQPTTLLGRYQSANYYLLSDVNARMGGAGGQAPGANIIVFWQVVIREPIKFDGQTLRVETLGTSAKMWPGLWASSTTTGNPTGSPILTGAEADASTAAFKTDSFTKTGFIPPGFYWAGLASNNGTAAYRVALASTTGTDPGMDLGSTTGVTTVQLSVTAPWTYSSSALPDVSAFTFTQSTTIQPPYVRWKAERS